MRRHDIPRPALGSRSISTCARRLPTLRGVLCADALALRAARDAATVIGLDVTTLGTRAAVRYQPGGPPSPSLQLNASSMSSCCSTVCTFEEPDDGADIAR